MGVSSFVAVSCPGSAFSAAASVKTAMSTLSMPRIIDASEVLRRNFTLDTAKNCFFVYFIARRALKFWRHVRARGLFQSFRDFYALIAQVLIYFISSIPPLRYILSFLQRTLRLVIALPSFRKRIDTEMEATRAQIDRQLIPQGKDVERHLSLPKKGQTLEWILEAMEQMDREAPSQTDYREGKLSGAVYRTHTSFLPPIDPR
jgi:sphinganine-1-phosphate aldolase